MAGAIRSAAKELGLDGSEPPKICPKCNRKKRVDGGFGYRFSGGYLRAQSWCKDCRGVRTESTVRLSDNHITTKRTYQQHYPNDRANRSWRFMVGRLTRKLGSDVTLTPEAQVKLRG